jgi:putative NADPH-quinone reductase
MRVLLVVAHPLEDSFAKAAAARVRATLERRGMFVDLIDLYEESFDPVLGKAERAGYFISPYNAKAVENYAERLRQADKLALVFPQWWFNLPAILKGFLDRVFVPGVAFEHKLGGGLIPLLTKIDAFYVVSSTGSPWHVARLYMGDPVRRQLGRGVKAILGPRAKFKMFTLHDMDRMSFPCASSFLDRVERAFATF